MVENGTAIIAFRHHLVASNSAEVENPNQVFQWNHRRRKRFLLFLPSALDHCVCSCHTDCDRSVNTVLISHWPTIGFAGLRLASINFKKETINTTLTSQRSGIFHSHLPSSPSGVSDLNRSHSPSSSLHRPFNDYPIYGSPIGRQPPR